MGNAMGSLREVRLIGLVVGALLPVCAPAKEWVVQAGAGSESLQSVLNRAAPGDTVRVIGGVYRGHFVVSKPLTLIGEQNPVLDSGRQGSVITLKAPRTVLRGFVIRNSGVILNDQDSAVRVQAPDCVVEHNRIEDALFGIHLDYAHRTVVRHNFVRSHDLPVARRGDQIRIWYSHRARIENNTVVGGRDLVFWYSEGITVRANHVRHSRYGVHFMYCSDSFVEDNLLHENSVGIYLMYSKRVRVRGNRILNNRGISGMGLGIKDMDGMHIEDNLIANNRTGLFVDSGEGVYRNNWFVRNDTGINLVLAVKQNRFEGNRFVENYEHVRLERPDSVAGVSWQGNYWSDYSGYDADGDGYGDVPYRAARVFDLLTARNSALQIMHYSLSAQALDFGARLFPLFAPRALVQDPQPLVQPGRIPLDAPRTEGVGSMLWVSTGVLGLGTLCVAPLRRRARSHNRVGRAPKMKTSSAPVVVVEALTRKFGKNRAVKSVSFVVREGETIALWGANGAGKTTILRCMLGLLRFEGSIHILGIDARRESVRVRQFVGYVPQLIHLHPDLTVRETLEFYAQIRGATHERTETLLCEWGLEDHADKPVHALSGGLKQKLALTLALLSDPPILLLDEPTAHLDAAARAEWLELLRRLKAEGKTLIFCTHQFPEVRALADRVIVLENGEKAAELTGEQFTRLWLRRGSLRLTLSPNDAPRALQILYDARYDAEMVDGLLVVRHVEAKRIEPIRLLLDAGIEILDYEWRAPIESPDWNTVPEPERYGAAVTVSERMPPAAAEQDSVRKGELQRFLGLARLLARKEIRDLRRNRWVLLLTGVFTGLSVLLTAFGLGGVGETGGMIGFGRTFASLLNLSLLIVPLMGLLVGAMSIATERDQQTLHTLLAQPISASAIVWGKFIGALAVLAAAVFIGFGGSGLIIYAYGADVPFKQFLTQMGLTMLLGWACMALGMLVSTLTRRTATAIGLALLLWLTLTFVSDLGIIGTAIALRLRAQTLLWLTLANPLQAFKIAVIQIMEGNLEALGSAGLYARDLFEDKVLHVCTGALTGWLAAAFLLALGYFTRKGAIE
jgi:nitrous oxidase accessory protein